MVCSCLSGTENNYGSNFLIYLSCYISGFLLTYYILKHFLCPIFCPPPTSCPLYFTFVSIDWFKKKNPVIKKYGSSHTTRNSRQLLPLKSTLFFILFVRMIEKKSSLLPKTSKNMTYTDRCLNLICLIFKKKLYLSSYCFKTENHKWIKDLNLWS